MEKNPKQPDESRAPWVLRVPSVLQINSSLIFIALMATILGIAALLGISDPQSITSQMAYPFYKLWGFGLAFSGTALIWGIVKRDELIEKFAARILSFGLGAFVLWAIAAVGFQRSVVTLTLGTTIIFLLEQRVSFINVLMYARKLAQHKLDREGEDHQEQ